MGDCVDVLYYCPPGKFSHDPVAASWHIQPDFQLNSLGTSWSSWCHICFTVHKSSSTKSEDPSPYLTVRIRFTFQSYCLFFVEATLNICYQKALFSSHPRSYWAGTLRLNENKWLTSYLPFKYTKRLNVCGYLTITPWHTIVPNVFTCNVAIFLHKNQEARTSSSMIMSPCTKPLWAPWSSMVGSGRTQLSCMEPWLNPFGNRFLTLLKLQ